MTRQITWRPNKVWGGLKAQVAGQTLYAQPEQGRWIVMPVHPYGNGIRALAEWVDNRGSIDDAARAIVHKMRVAAYR